MYMSLNPSPSSLSPSDFPPKSIVVGDHNAGHNGRRRQAFPHCRRRLQPAFSCLQTQESSDDGSPHPTSRPNSSYLRVALLDAPIENKSVGPCRTEYAARRVEGDSKTMLPYLTTW